MFIKKIQSKHLVISGHSCRFKLKHDKNNVTEKKIDINRYIKSQNSNKEK